LDFIIVFIIGVLVGAGIVLAVVYVRDKTSASQAHVAGCQMREAFSHLAAEALDANSKRLSKQASDAMDGKKQLIDQSVVAMNKGLLEVRKYLQQVETDRKQDFGKLSNSVSSLSVTTGELHRILGSTQRRGSWGERMADDVLRLAGMIEGVNFSQQSSQDAESGRPDFTFFLPNDLKVNMDVKFPLGSYKSYLDAETDDARQGALAQLVRAVKKHIGDVASRGYIDPQVPTVNYVLLFMPSEQIFALALEADSDLIDEALKKRIVLASPFTLYAMLSVIRQAAESANVMRTADEVIDILTKFSSQWESYKDAMGKLGDRIEQTQKQFDQLIKTRTNMLEKPLRRVEQLRQQGDEINPERQ